LSLVSLLFQTPYDNEELIICRSTTAVGCPGQVPAIAVDQSNSSYQREQPQEM